MAATTICPVLGVVGQRIRRQGIVIPAQEEGIERRSAARRELVTAAAQARPFLRTEEQPAFELLTGQVMTAIAPEPARTIGTRLRDRGNIARGWQGFLRRRRAVHGRRLRLLRSWGNWSGRGQSFLGRGRSLLRLELFSRLTGRDTQK